MSPGGRDWQADFAVFDQKGQLAVIAEAKKKTGADPRWAAEWFRNFAARQHSPAPPFVLLATPQTLYLWKGTEKASEPTVAADARSLFAAYLRNSNLEVSSISGSTFEFIVGAWLEDVSNGLWQPSGPEERRVLADSGLLEALENGRVVADVAA